MSVTRDKNKIDRHFDKAALSKETPEPILTVQGLCPLRLETTRPKTTGHDEQEDILKLHGTKRIIKSELR